MATECADVPLRNYSLTHSLSQVCLFKGRQPSGAVLHSLHEPGELSQRLSVVMTAP